jgi:hypothetical protein
MEGLAQMSRHRAPEREQLVARSPASAISASASKDAALIQFHQKPSDRGR